MIARQFIISIPDTQDELERLANQLDRSGDAIAATRLRKLNAAVGGDPAASPEDWAATDIEKVINLDAIVEGIKGRAVPGKRVRVLELLRNSLVILPLILTWLGIWQATSAYQALVTAHNELAGQTFLYLWEQGFNGNLFPAFILSNLALADFTLLGIIFVMTLIVSWQYNLVNTQSEKNAEQLRESLAHALGDAMLCLAMASRQRREQQPKDLADVARYLYQFGQQFQQTAQQFLNELAEERKRRGDMTAFTTALEKITRDMLSAADSMRQTNAELTTTIKEVLVPVKEIPKLVVAAGQAVTQLNTMVATLEQLVADQGRWRQELQNVLANGLAQLTADQRKATQDLHTLLDASLRQLQSSLIQQIAEQHKQGQDLQNMLSTRLGDVATQLNTSLGQLVSGQQLLGKELLDAADTLDTTASDLSLVVQGIQDCTKEQVKMLEALRILQADQKRLADEMTAATVEIKNVLKSTREAGPELRAMSVDMANFVSAMRDVPNALKNELLDPLKHYSGAAANVAAGSNTLEKAARYLESAANKLDGRLGP